jgi:REP element-mobilizing transposase RayT
LAPWQRQDLDFSARGGGGEGLVGVDQADEESAKALAALRGKPALYHCISRIVDRRFVLGTPEKEHFVRLMRLYERFCKVRVLSFCVMSNHFHLLLEVPERPAARPSDEALLAHLAILYPAKQLGAIRWELEHHRAQGNDPAAEALKDKYLRRMYDLSAFMKVLKQRFTQWFNPRHERKGTLWEDRFKSVLVEDGHAARVTSAYIDLNPVRAGMVDDPKDYRWCGYAEAVAGKKAARAGLQRVLFEKISAVSGEARATKEAANWRQLGKLYRKFLFLDGQAPQPGKEGGSRKAGRHHLSDTLVKKVLDAGGTLTEGEMLYCQVRYLVDGLAIGSREFLNRNFRLTRSSFSPRRRDGARKLRGIKTDLHAMRDLQLRVVS